MVFSSLNFLFLFFPGLLVCYFVLPERWREGRNFVLLALALLGWFKYAVLWTAFDETRSLDLRHYTASTLEDYIADYRPDVAICLRDDLSYLTSFD